MKTLVNRHWLSELIDLEISKRKIVALINKTNFREILAYPGKQAALLISSIFIFITLVIRDCHFLKFEMNIELGSIHAVIGTIIFALVIFIVESMRDENDKDRGRVLLRESYLWCLTIMEVYSLLAMVLFQNIFVDIFWILFMGVFTIFSLSNVINILLNKSKYLKKREELHKERMSAVIIYEIRERIGRSLLNQYLENVKNIQFGVYIDRSDKTYHLFKLKTTGRILDINIQKLGELIEKTEYLAREQNCSFEDLEKYVSDDFGGNLNDTKNKDAGRYPKLKVRYLVKNFKDLVSTNNKVAFMVDKKLNLTEEKYMELENDIQGIFKVGKETSYLEEINYEIRNLRNQLLAAIEKRNTNAIEEYLEIYNCLCETFLEFLKTLGGGYTAVQAQKEQDIFGGGWSDINKAYFNLRDVFTKAFQTEDTNVIGIIASFPMNILYKSMIYKDNYLFREFTNYYLYFYRYSRISKNEDIKKLLFYKSYKDLKDIVDYHFSNELEKPGLNISEIERLKEMLVFILRIYQLLMREAFNDKEKEKFEIYAKTVQGIYEHIKASEYYLEDISKDEFQNVYIANHLMDVENHLEGKKQEMLFGFASWLTEKYMKSPQKEMFQYLNIVDVLITNNISELTTLFCKTYNYDIDTEWEWSFWDMKEEDGAQYIDAFGKLNKYYAIKALKILNINAEIITLGKYEYDSSKAHIFSEEGQLWKTLKLLEENKNKFPDLVNEINQIDKLRILIKKFVNDQNESEKALIRNTNISVSKVDEFIKDYINGFYESSKIRNAFKHYGLLENKIEEKKSKYALGMNTVDAKEAFFEKWHVRFPRWGYEYGRNMGFSENKDILKKLTKISKKNTGLELYQVMNKIEDLNKYIILCSSDMYRYFWDDQNYESNRKNESSEMKLLHSSGYLKFKGYKIPIIDIVTRNDEKTMLLMNMKKIGKLIQFAPKVKKIYKMRKVDVFEIFIDAYSENESILKEIIDNPPEWLKAIGEKEKQIFHLKERVLIVIYESYKVRFDKNPECYFIKRILTPKLKKEE